MIVNYLFHLIQRGTESNGNEGVHYTLQNWTLIIRYSLVSYPGYHLWGGIYGISTTTGYLIPTLVSTQISDIYDL